MSDDEVTEGQVVAVRNKGGRPTKAATQKRIRELNEKQLLYVNWIASPPMVRKPATAKDLAAFLDVHEATLWRWGQDPQIALAARYVALQRSGDPHRVSVALDFLYGHFSGEYEDREFALKCVKEWLKAVGVHDTFKVSSELLGVEYQDDLDLSQLSDDELWDLQKKYEAAVAGGGLFELASGVDPVDEAAGIQDFSEKVTGDE